MTKNICRYSNTRRYLKLTLHQLSSDTNTTIYIKYLDEEERRDTREKNMKC